MFTQTLKDLTLTIANDNDAESPRNWDNIGTVAFTSRRYAFGDELKTSDELVELMHNPDCVYLKIYLYDHSGIAISTSPFSCQWDSGLAGLIYAFPEMHPEMTRDEIVKALQSEVSDLNQWVEGEVYWYRIEDSKGDCLESCGGFFGLECCKEAGLEELKRLVDDREKAAELESAESEYWACRDVVTA